MASTSSAYQNLSLVETPVYVRFGSGADITLSREPVHPQLNPRASSKNYIPNFELRFGFQKFFMGNAEGLSGPPVFLRFKPQNIDNMDRLK